MEDEPKIRNELKVFLERNGHSCDSPDDFSNIEDSIVNCKCNLVLLDINLPYIDGYHVFRKLKKISNIPVIIVTSRNTEIDELLSMNLGADDFITKPYNTQILLARISAVLNRVYNNKSKDVVHYKNLILDISQSIVKNSENKKSSELSKNELKILYLLMQNGGKIVCRDDIMNYLWQSDNFIDDNTLTVNINRIRKKLSSIGVENYLLTKRGQGYMV